MTKYTNNPNKIKKENIKPKPTLAKDLSQYLHDFREEAKPLVNMLENRISRLDNASEASRPYILSDIQKLSDGIVNLEGLFGALIGDYCELGDKAIYLLGQWRGASWAMMSLKEALIQVSKERNELNNRKNANSCQ